MRGTAALQVRQPVAHRLTGDTRPAGGLSQRTPPGQDSVQRPADGGRSDMLEGNDERKAGRRPCGGRSCTSRALSRERTAAPLRPNTPPARASSGEPSRRASSRRPGRRRGRSSRMAG
jgi:hypothetical protein